MAFAQQRRPAYTRALSSTTTDSQLDIDTPSDTDWHVLSSVSNTSSPNLFPTSESESSLIEFANQQVPGHDGTGTFLMEDVEFFSSDQATTTSDSSEDDNNELKSALENLNAGDSILDMLVEKEPPSFMKKAEFVPTTAGLNSQELISKVEELSEKASVQQLDRIPVHPPQQQNALLTIVWDSLKRLTHHLIENDTNTVETLSNLMSEAVLEGCMPFGSHLHMDTNHFSLLEVE